MHYFASSIAVALVLVGSGCGQETADARPPDPVLAAPVGEARPIDPPSDVDVPNDMGYVPGGTTAIGVLVNEGGMVHERPAFEAAVEPFLIDRSPVTVVRFREFASSTGFQTQAEGFGDAMVMDQSTGAWRLVPGADWQRPFGPDGLVKPDGHPVTQVSWNDANAFCAWDGEGAKRLPTEVEWEYAARGGTERARYPWGWGEPEGRACFDTDAAMAVGSFRANPYGLHDMAGNVFEWCAGKEPGRPARGGSFWFGVFDRTIRVGITPIFTRADWMGSPP